ncbi:MAG: hypothetical protein KC925_03465 [Candidatus Doudnabacteria bacterium]|nr:hypothetical protein [Candidatus Doudnabacteria bacterium]MCA9387449.1 hypothetical protein [Candidatus Andersenbacteria bacterium]
MYYFVYDAITTKRRFERRVSQIVLNVNDLELPHDKALVTSLNTVEALVEEALEKDVFDTVIAVGNDRTARSAMNAILRHRAQAHQHRNVSFGFIPIQDSGIGRMLGMPIGAEAVPIISRRRQEALDVGRMNKGFFVGSVVIRSAARFDEAKKWSHRILHGRELQPVHVRIDVNGLIVETDVAYLAISNLLAEDERAKIEKQFRVQLPRSTPQDGTLQLAILGTERNANDLTVFHATECMVETDENVLADIDGVELRQHVFRFSLEPSTLNVIIGPNREF